MLFLNLSSVYSLEEIMYFNWLLDIDRMSPLIEINMTTRKRAPTCITDINFCLTPLCFACDDTRQSMKFQYERVCEWSEINTP